MLCISLLKHPLVLTALNKKWEGYGRGMYYTDFIIYVITLLLLSSYSIWFAPVHQELDQDIIFKNYDTSDFSDQFKLNYLDYERNNMILYCEVASELNKSVANDYIGNSGNMRNRKNEIENLCDSTYRDWRNVIKVILCIFITVRLGIEAFSMVAIGLKKYFLDPTNYLELVMYLLVFFYLIEFEIIVDDPKDEIYHWSFVANNWDGYTYPRTPWQHICGSVAVLLSWSILLLFIRQFPKFGLYILMFTHILKTFSEFLLILMIFQTGFALTFMMLLHNQIPFHSLDTCGTKQESSDKKMSFP